MKDCEIEVAYNYINANVSSDLRNHNMRRVLAYILFLFAVGFLAVAYFANYTGTLISNKFTFYFIGLFCFVIGWIILRSPSKEKNPLIQKKYGRWLTC